MAEFRSESAQDRLIAELAGTLTPVKPLAPPLPGALAWLALVVAIGVAATPFADMPALRQRLMATPDMWLAVIGSILTAIFAALAAFQLSRPDRSPRWALLPIPSALLWIGASGAGCLRAIPLAGLRDPTMGDGRDCLLTILGLSIPLSLAMLAMLRRGYSLQPSLTAAIAGLAVAAAAATLLMFFHPFDATLSDLVAHVAGVALVIGAIRWFGVRSLAPKNLTGAA